MDSDRKDVSDAELTSRPALPSSNNSIGSVCSLSRWREETMGVLAPSGWARHSPSNTGWDAPCRAAMCRGSRAVEVVSEDGPEPVAAHADLASVISGSFAAITNGSNNAEMESRWPSFRNTDASVRPLPPLESIDRASSSNTEP